MDRQIWSKLPREILIEIVRYAAAQDCKEGAPWQKWIEAVQSDIVLHSIILQQQWYRVVMTWSDFVRSDLQGIKDVSETTIDKLSCKDYAVYPAKVIRELRLDLYMNEELSRHVSSTYQIVMRTMNKLIPIMSSLRRIEINGSPCGKVLEWDNLAKTNLTTISIGVFVEGEAKNLISLIANTPTIKELNLRVTRVSAESKPPSLSPLQALFRPDYAQADTYKNLLLVFPAGFRRLSMKDPYFTGSKSLRIESPSEVDEARFSLCQLRELDLETDDMQSASNLLEWLPNANLETLSVSPVVPSDLSSTKQDHSLQIIKDIVSDNLASLRLIVLSNAWKITEDFANSFNRQWNSTLKITDLVLSTDCPQRIECQEQHDLVQFSQMDLKHLLYGCSKNVERWGASIERVRLEMKDAAHEFDLTLPGLTDFSVFKNLRMLIISPRDDCPGHQISQKQHQRIANYLADRTPDTLRFIMLCNYAYWVDDSHMSQEDSEARRERRANLFNPDAQSPSPQHKSLIQAFETWKTVEDAEFMHAYSWMNVRRLEHNERIRPTTLNQYWLQSFNFLVARRVQHGTSTAA